MDNQLLITAAVIVASLPAHYVINLNHKKRYSKKLDDVRTAADDIAQGIEHAATQSELNFWQNEISLLLYTHGRKGAVIAVCQRLQSLLHNRSMFLQATKHIDDARKLL